MQSFKIIIALMLSISVLPFTFAQSEYFTDQEMQQARKLKRAAFVSTIVEASKYCKANQPENKKACTKKMIKTSIKQMLKQERMARQTCRAEMPDATTRELKTCAVFTLVTLAEEAISTAQEQKAPPETVVADAGDELLIAIEKINDLRADAGLNRLAAQTELMNIAQAHAEDMRDYDYFDHTDRDGGAPADRATAAGYDWTMISENIAYGGSTDQAIELWLDSPGHNANIYREGVTETGFGIATDDQGVMYFVQVFGDR